MTEGGHVLHHFLALAPPPGGEGEAPNPIITFLPFVLMIAVVWLLLIRPQRKKQKEHTAMLAELSKGDRVVTSSGILGTVVGIKDNIVVLKVGESPETKMEFLKSSVTSRINA
jgi:preprotein translocase subunit YajC